MQPLYLPPVFTTNIQTAMKNILSILILLIGVAEVFGQESQTRSVGAFSGVKVAEGVDVYLRKGDKESVRVEVTGTKPENVVTEVSGSFLKVHMREGNFRNNVDVKVYVTFVSLDKLSASSAGSIFSEGTIAAKGLEISASSAGTIEVALDAESVEVNASSAADIELTGKSKALSVDVSSAGELDAYGLEAQKVQAEASSAGSIKISVVSELVAHASSGGSIRFRGNPSKSITDSSSGGSVKKSN
jgi:hypothetical protein